MPPYFLLSFVSLQSEEQLGRLFATGEISGDGMWSHRDSDEDEDECHVVNSFDYFHGVSFSQV